MLEREKDHQQLHITKVAKCLDCGSLIDDRQ